MSVGEDDSSHMQKSPNSELHKTEPDLSEVFHCFFFFLSQLGTLALPNFALQFQCQPHQHHHQLPHSFLPLFLESVGLETSIIEPTPYVSVPIFKVYSFWCGAVVLSAAVLCPKQWFLQIFRFRMMYPFTVTVELVTHKKSPLNMCLEKLETHLSE